MSRWEPLFVDLMFNEEGQPVQVAQVGGEHFYAIPDGDFLRHIEAREVDRQVLARLKERLLSMKDAVIEGVLQMMGSDDPFTRAAVEMSLENLDRIPEVGAGGVNLEDLRLWLWMTGFRVTVDIHGEVVHVELPGADEAP